MEILPDRKNCISPKGSSDSRSSSVSCRKPVFSITKKSGEKVETINAEPVVANWCEKPWHVVQDSVTQTCRHWIDTVPHNKKPETSVDDNLKTLKLVEAAYQSAAKGGSLITLNN